MRRALWIAGTGITAAGLRLAAATNSAAYTLDDCLASGLARHARLANAARGIELAEARVRQVRAQILPTASVSGAGTWQKSVAFDTGGDAVTLSHPYDEALHLFGGVDQLLYDGGSARAALRAAAAYRGTARAAVVQARSEVIRDIRQAFTDLLLAEAAARVRAQSVTQLQAMADQADARFRQGLAPEFERNSARVRVANDRPMLIRAQAEAAVARTRLRHVACVPEEGFVVRGELSFVPFDGPLAELLRNAEAWRPELVRARQRITLARADLRVSQGRYAPQFRARAGYQGDNPPAGESGNRWEWGLTATVTMNWPLYDGGLREAEIAAKRLELANAEEDLGELLRAVRLELATLDAAREAAAAVVRATAESVELAAQTLAIAEARYTGGLATYLEFTDAQQALRTAQLARLEAVAVHARSVAALICARGEPPAPRDGEE